MLIEEVVKSPPASRIPEGSNSSDICFIYNNLQLIIFPPAWIPAGNVFHAGEKEVGLPPLLLPPGG